MYFFEGIERVANPSFVSISLPFKLVFRLAVQLHKCCFDVWIHQIHCIGTSDTLQLFWLEVYFCFYFHLYLYLYDLWLPSKLVQGQIMAVAHYDVCYVPDRPICPIRTSQTHAMPSFRRKRENDPIALEILILVRDKYKNEKIFCFNATVYLKVTSIDIQSSRKCCSAAAPLRAEQGPCEPSEDVVRKFGEQ